MKWKDSGEMVDGEEETKEEYFDEEHYSPWAERKESKKGFKLGKIQVLSVLLGVAIVALVAALLVLLLNNGGDGVATQRISAFEQRLQKLEERLDRYEGIDEKVTTIWEQAKSFEKFKDRFDRSEASTSLRMDEPGSSAKTAESSPGTSCERPAKRRCSRKNATKSPVLSGSGRRYVLQYQQKV